MYFDQSPLTNRPVQKWLGAALALLFLGTAVPKEARAQSDTEQIWSTVQTFFQALSSSDSTLLSQVYMPEGRFYSVSAGANGIRTGSSTHESVHAMFRRPEIKSWSGAGIRLFQCTAAPRWHPCRMTSTPTRALSHIAA